MADSLEQGDITPGKPNQPAAAAAATSKPTVPLTSRAAHVDQTQRQQRQSFAQPQQSMQRPMQQQQQQMQMQAPPMTHEQFRQQKMQQWNASVERMNAPWGRGPQETARAPMTGDERMSAALANKDRSALELSKAKEGLARAQSAIPKRRLDLSQDQVMEREDKRGELVKAKNAFGMAQMNSSLAEKEVAKQFYANGGQVPKTATSMESGSAAAASYIQEITSEVKSSASEEEKKPAKPDPIQQKQLDALKEQTKLLQKLAEVSPRKVR